MVRCSNKIGFTVIELSIVLVIIGIILFFSIDFIEIVSKQNKNTDARNQLEQIDDAIVRFVKENGRLPCPADRDGTKPSASFGVETTPGGSCATQSGVDITNLGTDGGGTNPDTEIVLGAVPTRSLGLPDLHGIDPWGNKISYVVVSYLTQRDDYAFKNKTPDAAKGIYSTDGVIQLVDADTTGNQITQTTVPGKCVSAANSTKCPIVAYLLFSHGQAGSGSYSLQSTSAKTCAANLDAENCDYNDNQFIVTPLNDGDVAANYFDDIMLFKLKSQLDWELRE